MSGKLIIFSAPSGSGKTTIVRHLLSNHKELEFSISACTRSPRDGEVDGTDYYFLSPEEFQHKVVENKFAEWEEVYPGRYYGTLKEEIERIWKKGNTVIFDVDVIGGVNLKKVYGDKALAVFVKVPSIKELEKRLGRRGTESEESLKERLDKVKFEMSFEDQFDVTLVNDKLETSFEKAEKLLQDFLRA